MNKRKRSDKINDGYRARAFIGVWNNYGAQDYHDVLNCKKFKYVIVGREVGESGTPHLQFYVRFDNAVRFQTLKGLFPKVHWEPAFGNFEENFAYCSKQGDWEERGEAPTTQAERLARSGDATKCKWEEAKELAVSGRMDEIQPEMYIRYYNVFKNIAKDKAKPPEDLPTPDGFGGYGLWLYGATGTGKSYQARMRYPGAYLKTSNNKWWDGYDGHEFVLMDDLDKKHDYMCYHLKIWADRYAFIAETKGSSIIIRPKIIVVTSNYHPSEIWDSSSDLDPIMRRFTIEKIESGREPVVDVVSASYIHGFVPPPAKRDDTMSLISF